MQINENKLNGDKKIYQEGFKAKVIYEYISAHF